MAAADITEAIGPRVQREIDAAGGDLGLAIHILRNDACGSHPDAPIRSILREALRLQSERAKAPVQCGPRSAARYCFQAMGAA